jgi:hypothetical protein
MDARKPAENAVFSLSPVKKRVGMLANGPESFALEATCVIVMSRSNSLHLAESTKFFGVFCHNVSQSVQVALVFGSEYFRLVDSRLPAHWHHNLVYGLIVALAREDLAIEEKESFSKD